MRAETAESQKRSRAEDQRLSPHPPSGGTNSSTSRSTRTRVCGEPPGSSVCRPRPRAPSKTDRAKRAQKQKPPATPTPRREQDGVDDQGHHATRLRREPHACAHTSQCYSPGWRARTPSNETTSRSGGSSSSRNASTAVAPLDLIAFREAAGRSVGRNLDPHATSTRTDRDSAPLRAISHDQPASASTPPGDGPNLPAAPTRCHLAAIGGHYA
jgi:hypothetical protein